MKPADSPIATAPTSTSKITDFPKSKIKAPPMNDSRQRGPRHLAYLFDDLLIAAIPKLAELFFALLSLMIGSIVTVGQGWGTILRSRTFAPFWKLFAFFFLEILAYVVLQDAAIGIIEQFLRTNILYVTGLTSALIGVFFLWFVYSFGFSLKTQYKWAFPVICILISVGNIVVYHCAVLGIQC